MGALLSGLGIIGLIVFVVLLARGNRSRIPKMGIFICIAAIALGIALPSNSSEDQDESSSSESVEKKVSYTADAASLKKLFNHALSIKTDSLSVKYDETNKCYTLSYHPSDDSYDETNLVQQGISNYIKYCKKAYTVQGVTSIDFEISTEMIDSYGKSSIDNVLSIRMPKANFSKFNWKNLEYMPIYDNFKDNCEFFWIYPSILKNVKTEKVSYIPKS